jgi:hypothetical protein
MGDLYPRARRTSTPVHRQPVGQADSLANRVGGADLALTRLEIDESPDVAKYGMQLRALDDQPALQS